MALEEEASTERPDPGSAPGRPPARRRASPYRVLFETMSEGFIFCRAVRDPSGRLTDYVFLLANPAFLRGFGEGEDIVGRTLRELRPDAPEAWFANFQHTLDTGEPRRLQYFDRRIGRWFDVHCTRVSPDRFAHFYVDITEIKAAERHKAELLAELNHRVKNNLAIVASLLTLQARGKSAEVREQLDRAVDRIQAIADLHAGLNQADDPEEVDIQAYLETLARRLSRSLSEDTRVRVEVEAPATRLRLDLAVDLGIVVNELVTNAAKHAYPPPAEGMVTVRLKTAPGELVLFVGDAGKGLPAGGPAASGLGMRVVKSLIQKRGGALTTRNAPGACFEIRLPWTAADPAEAQGQLI